MSTGSLAIASDLENGLRRALRCFRTDGTFHVGHHLPHPAALPLSPFRPRSHLELFLGLDAGLLAGILAIDMGGYQLAGELSASQEMVRYAGLVIAATLGCTITFTIPVGIGMLKAATASFLPRHADRHGHASVTMIVGGLLSGLSFLQIVLQSLPVLLFCFLLMFGILAFSGADRARVHGICRCDPASDDDRPHRGRVLLYDRLFAAPGPCAAGGRDGGRPSIGIVLLGSLPTAELLQRVLKKPLSFIGRKTGMNDSSAAGLLMGIVSPVPAITMMEKWTSAERL